MSNAGRLRWFCRQAISGLAFAAMWPLLAHAQTTTGAAAPPAPPQASAANGGGITLQEVMVTARRHAEALEKVPEAVDAVRPATIDARGVFSANSITEVAPGIHMQAVYADRQDAVMTIRGQGQTAGTEYPSVLTYFNEVALPRLSTGEFFDLENLQVLRGPQGTLFGRVTDGGAVLLTPAKPVNDFEGSIEGKFGNYGLNDYLGVLNVPIINDKLLVRASFDINRRNGFTYDRGVTPAQAAAGAVDPNAGRWFDDIHYDSYRVSVVARPTDNFENYTVFAYFAAHESGSGLQLTAVDAPILTGVFGSLFPPAVAAGYTSLMQQEVAQNLALGPRSTALSEYEFSDRLNVILTNTTTWRVNDNLTIRNIFGWVRDWEEAPDDFDASFLPLIETNRPPFAWVNFKQYSEELQFQGKALQNMFTWQGGFYADLKQPDGIQEDYITELFALVKTQEVMDTDHSYAVYGQGTYDFSNWIHGLRFTAGLRYTKELNISMTNQATIISPTFALCPITTTAGGSTPAQAGAIVAGTSIISPNPAGCAFTFRGPENALTYNFTVDYDLAPDKMVYIATRRGFKGGGFNWTYSSLDTAGYAPEYIQDVEIGFKGDWRLGDMRARTNIDLYRANETNIQRLVVFVLNSSIDSAIRNAASAIVQGVEFEGTLVPVQGLTLGLKWVYTDANYNKSDAAAACGSVVTTPEFCPLNRIADAPLNQISLDVHYTIPMDQSRGSITMGGSWNYQTSVALTDNSYEAAQAGEPNAPLQPAYSLLNFDATWSNFLGKPIDLSLFITNATNQTYAVGSTDLSYNFGISGYLYGEPRMFGGSIKWRFGQGS